VRQLSQDTVALVHAAMSTKPRTIAELARDLGLKRSTVRTALARLTLSGLVAEFGSTAAGTRGRPAKTYVAVQATL
jgi:predicted ArsR family transcriptional regulator